MNPPQFSLAGFYAVPEHYNHFLEATIAQEGFHFTAYISESEDDEFKFMSHCNIPEHTDVQLFGDSVEDVILKLNEYLVEEWGDIMNLIDTHFR